MLAIVRHKSTSLHKSICIASAKNIVVRQIACSSVVKYEGFRESQVNYRSRALLHRHGQPFWGSGHVRWTHPLSSQILCIRFYTTEPLKPSSKVEETVQIIKEKAKEAREAASKVTAETAGGITLEADQPIEVKNVEEMRTEAIVRIDQPSSPPTPPPSSPPSGDPPSGAPAPKPPNEVAPKPPKKPIKQRIKDELMHYYHGFRLLFIDINVAMKLLGRVLKGHQLSRREHKLLVRTVGDMFRLVPFSVFIIVPFAEFALPFFIKFFPGMMPSTFQTASDREAKIKKNLKVKIEMAKFLQKTLDELPVTSKGSHHSQAAKEFATFFEKVRTSGGMTTTDEIMKFSKLFEDEITLDSLPRPQLMALCRVLEMNPIGTTNFLRFQLRLKLRSLAADDLMIQKEGIDSLSLAELQAACRARGMRALGVSEERLKAQLAQWLDLSLVKKVPPSLLLLSQAFMLPDNISTSEKLAATISALPDAVGTHTKVAIGEREGKIDNKAQIELIKEEMNLIRQEKLEQMEAKRLIEEREEREALVDKAPVIGDKAPDMEPPSFKDALKEVKTTSEKLAGAPQAEEDFVEITVKDLESLEKALDVVGQSRHELLVEKGELQEIKQEMAEYQEDIAELQKVLRSVTASNKELEVHETKAAKRLYSKVNKMLNRIDSLMHTIEKDSAKVDQKSGKDEPQAADAALPKEKVPPHYVETLTPLLDIRPALRDQLSGNTDTLLRTEEILSAIKKIEPTEKLSKIEEILKRIDEDNDGVVRVGTLLKILEMAGKEDFKLSKKQIDEFIELIRKEEAIELDELMLKQLRQSTPEIEAIAESYPEVQPEPTPDDKGTKASPPSDGSNRGEGSAGAGPGAGPSQPNNPSTQRSSSQQAKPSVIIDAPLVTPKPSKPRSKIPSNPQ